MNSLNRRLALKSILGGLGSIALGQNLLSQPSYNLIPKKFNGGPKRVVFFLQNQGFEPKTCIPTNMTSSGSLAKAVLPEPIQALQPFREKIHIINGLHGQHTSPSHSAFFWCLGWLQGK